MITGAAGSGKSALALELMGIGADLVGDDRVVLTRQEDEIFARPAPGLEGRIEARFIGIIRVPFVPYAAIRFVADLNQTCTERLPAHQTRDILGCKVPQLALAGVPKAAFAVRALLIGGLEPQV